MSPEPAVPETVVVTRLTFGAPPSRAWDTLMFYEQLESRPPLHLRLLLPVPIRTEGSKEKVGDEALCLYEGGSLIKRVTAVDQGRHDGFSVVKQDLDVGGGMRLSGGAYTLKELPDGRTEVEAVTRSLAALERERLDGFARTLPSDAAWVEAPELEHDAHSLDDLARLAALLCALPALSPSPPGS